MAKIQKSQHPSFEKFLVGKSDHTRSLFEHFVREYRTIGNIQILPAKTMIGISTPRKRIAYVTQLGKNFIHVVFPFKQPYPDNLCFQKIAQVPGDMQYNHHFRMLLQEDITDEVRSYMKLAYELGK